MCCEPIRNIFDRYCFVELSVVFFKCTIYVRALALLADTEHFSGILPPEEDKIMCPKCGKKYPRLQLLTHVQFECGKQTILQCPLCPRKCKRDDILQSHLRNIHRIN
ncbi:unnamed protein product [Callosobruchus maculatus]|uniref:C2H2-type domain-containing protein n=1 Tax=Callosobruchus maculatus TaxID=64391 RepID=A0A653DNK7_CALMS|nr:unnamed protein product [Callosobruchus maculatus]